MNPHEAVRESDSKLRQQPRTSELSGSRHSVAWAADLDPTQLAAVLRTDQCERWQAGDRVAAESYFERYPALGSAAEYAVDLVYSEYLLREELGDSPVPAEYLRRFPQFAPQLERQFALHAELNSTSNSILDEFAGTPPESSIQNFTAVRAHDQPGRPATALQRWGRFEIKQQLGVGGFGSVYRAFDPQLGRDVALKVPHAHLLTGEHRDRFLREARAAAQLQHPNLVAVYDSGVAFEGCYIAYQFVHGQTLARALKERTFSAKEAAELVYKLAQAAHHAHTKGVFHRDLKAANVLLDQQGEPFISDFGLVRLEGDATLTADATVLGTPAYMSPEQALGASHLADARSDVYTLGVVLYELLTGRLPFDGPPQSVLRQVAEQEPPSLRTLNDRVPRELETICLKAIAKRPTERYASAEHLADDLDRWLRHEPIHARPTTFWARAFKWSRRRPAAALLVATILAAALALFVVDASHNFRLRAANLQTQQLLNQTRQLLSQAQAERGVQLLEGEDTLGLLHLLEARRTAQELSRVRISRALLWAGWHNACTGRLAQVLGTEEEAELIEFSPDGKLLATGSGQGARLWDIETGQPRSDLLPHSRRVPVAFSLDGKLLVTAPPNEGPRLWETSTGKPADTQLPPFLKNVRSLAVGSHSSAPGLLAVGCGREVWLADLSTGEYFDKPLKHEGDVGSSIVFSRDGKLLATTTRAGERGIARLWRIDRSTASAQPVGRPIVHEHEIVSVVFSPNSDSLATAAWDDTARLWDTATGNPRGAPMRHRDDVWAVEFSPDGRLVATGSFDGTARLWDATAGKPLFLPLRHQGPVRTLDFSPDGKLLATGSFDGTIRLWNTANGQPHGWPLRHPGDVTSIAFSPDGQLLASSSSAGSSRLWNVSTESVDAQKVFQHASRVYTLALSPNDPGAPRLMATGAGDGTVRLWDASTGDLLLGPWQQQGDVLAVAIHPDGKLLAIGSAGPVKSTVELRDTTTGEIVGIPLRPHSPLRALAFSRDGKLLATGTTAGTVQLWDTSTGQRFGHMFRHKVSASDLQITAVAFSPDGKLLATGSIDKTVQLWEVETGDHHGPFLWHEGRVEALAFSPNGKRLATASSDLAVRFWDTATGQALPQTIRPPGMVQSLAFSPSGRLLATASVDGSARLWDLETGLSCSPPFIHDTFATAVAFSPDEQWLATGSFDKTARLWRLPQYLGDSDFDLMQLRTWVALGARLGSQGNVEAIPWQEWQRLRRTLSERE